MKKTFTLLLLFATAIAFAQAPQGMNYQAVVRNSQGNLVTSHAVGFKFNIRQGSGSGTVVYSETQTPTSDQFGGVSLVIGQGTVISGNFSNINWAGGTYFNEVLIDATGGTNYTSMGASQLMSVPYALYANSVGNSPNGFDVKFNGVSISDSSLDFAALGDYYFVTRSNYWFFQFRGNNLRLNDEDLLQTQHSYGWVTDTINNTPVYTEQPPGYLYNVVERGVNYIAYTPLNATPASVSVQNLYYYDPLYNHYHTALSYSPTPTVLYLAVANNPSVTGFNLTYPVNVTINRK
jgi:hypothetical protein